MIEEGEIYLLREAREALGYSREELAERACLAVSAICVFERPSGRHPKGEEALKLCRAMNIAPDQIVELCDYRIQHELEGVANLYGLTRWITKKRKEFSRAYVDKHGDGWDQAANALGLEPPESYLKD